MVRTRAQTKKMLDMEDFNHQSTEPGEIISSIDDLLTEILVRLPVTSILRFKSVSKHWRLLLSQKHFTQRYDNISKSPTGLIATDKYVPFDVENPSTPPFRCLNSYFDPPGVEIVQSCNGLLLCVTQPIGCKGAYKYYVFNPTTKQLALIPPVPRDRSAICFMGLAFHQTDCVRYKVICVLAVGPDVNSHQIQVYSSDTKEWKISIESFSASIPIIRHGVYWNGAVYWPSRFHNGNYWYFKIDDQQLHTLPLPYSLLPSKVVTKYLGESRGHLHFIAYKKFQGGMFCLNVYEMLSDHSGWFVKYQLQLDALPAAAFPNRIIRYGPGYKFQVIDVVRGEEEEDTFLVLKNVEKIITYNVHDMSFKQIYSLSNALSSSFYRCTETLSSF